MKSLEPTKKIKLELFDCINYTVLSLIVIITLYPFIYVLAGSFNEGMDYMRGGVYIFPRKFTLANFQMVFADERLWYGFTTTLARTIIGTSTALIFTAVVAYAMSRKDLPFRNQMYWINIITMFFGGGLIPYFLLLQKIQLLNTFWVYIIPGLYSVFNMIILQNFFRDIPEELHESAVIDGAGEYKIFFKIYLPLSAPALATVALWIAVGHWNSFFDSMVFTSNPKLQTLQLYLMKLIKEASITQGGSADRLPPQLVKTVSVVTIRYAAIVVSSLPILFAYPIIQGKMTTGLTLGSLKG